MNKKIIFLYFVINIFVITKMFSQFEYYNEDETPLISIDIKELNYDINYQEYFMADFASVCEGRLDSSLHYLLHIPKSRLKIKGQVPEKNIFVNAKNIYPTSSFDFKKIVIDVLAKKYHFDITEIKDSSEVWILEVKDNQKLAKFEVDIDNKKNISDGGMAITKAIMRNKVTKQYFVLDNLSLEYIVEFIDKSSESIVYLNVDLLKNYNLEIPIEIIKSSYSVLNQYLEDNFGLILKKEQRLEDFILVTFHN